MTLQDYQAIAMNLSTVLRSPRGKVAVLSWDQNVTEGGVLTVPGTAGRMRDKGEREPLRKGIVISSGWRYVASGDVVGIRPAPGFTLTKHDIPTLPAGCEVYLYSTPYHDESPATEILVRYEEC